jgi:Na+/H+ antiporter NhaD/arsenite permease-like protein
MVVLQLGPFVLLLLSIALLPLAAPKFWHNHWNKALVSCGLAAPAAVVLLTLVPNGESRLVHSLFEYVQFILLLTALYAISGVLVVHGDLPRGPFTNTLWLALGAVLANFIGTTGASMLLLRPLLRANHHRGRNRHVPIFFIFVVGNCGGLLLPLGDPPLFLGFLEGVDFFWTLRLWRQWLFVNALVLLVFYVWDAWAWRGEKQPLPSPAEMPNPMRLEGLWLGGALVLGVMATLLLQAESVGRMVGKGLRGAFANAPDPTLPAWGGIVLLAGLALLAGFAIPRSRSQAKVLVWGPLLEVAILFAGIFVAMTPALWLLSTLPALPWTEAGLVWATGSTSSVLDNAPTYLTFATLADPGGPRVLAVMQPAHLQAVSCGAVWMGALTYIGNGPNFLIHGVAKHMGYQMPSFFGYLVYALPVLLPIFGLATWLFFV